MAFIKTTNVVLDKKIEDNIRIVRCPYCKTFLQGISKNTTAMFCWHCKKEFRIQQDKHKFIDNSKEEKVKRTILGRL